MRAPTFALLRLGLPAGVVILHFPLAGTRSSPDRSTKSTRLRATNVGRAPAGRRHRVSGSLSLPSRGPFHLSLTVLIAIGHCSVFSLGRWSSRLHAGFLVSRATPDPAVRFRFSCTGLSPSSAGFPKTVPLNVRFSLRSLPLSASTQVWAPPRSLAATCGIDVSFFSSGYLDVSVPRLTFCALWIGAQIHEVCSCGFPHSDIRGSQLMCSSPRLFAAYRVLLRPTVPGHPPCALFRLTLLILLAFLSPYFSVRL